MALVRVTNEVCCRCPLIPYVTPDPPQALRCCLEIDGLALPPPVQLEVCIGEAGVASLV